MMETHAIGRRPTRISEENSSASLSVADVHLQGDHDVRSLSSASEEASVTYANDEDDQGEFVVEKREDKAVWTTKLMFLVFMTCCTIGVCLVVFKNTSEAERELFEGEFEDFSLKLLEALSSEVDSSLSAIDSLVVSFVSLSSFTNMTWPFVLMPDAGPRFAKVQSSTGAVFTAISPIISGEDLGEWNEWSIKHGSAWVDENLRLQEGDSGFMGKTIAAYNSTPIFTVDGISSQGQSYYLPAWQGYPTASVYPFNFDMISINDFPDFPWERQVILSPFMNAPHRNAFYNDWLSGFVGNDIDVTEPMSQWYYPVYEDAASEVYSSNLADGHGEMVAVVWTSFYWHMMFRGVLPEGVDGMVVVVENTCNDSATYVINGPDAEFQGYGDDHDPAYNGMVRESTLKNLSVYSTGSRHYTGLPPSDNSCSYSFRVYPSETFENLYRTSKPVTYTLTTVAIFIFTVAVFGIYDFIVEQRQAHLVSRAVKASALVSSLFPSNVRDRLLDRSERQPPHIAGNTATQKSQLKSWVHDSPHPNSDTQEQSDSSKDVSALDHPIADLFPEVTVMFGDIAGFTAWSSTRSPGHVFILLETLYGEFDRLATKRGVFKVETIGDCYLAVAGLPEPRDDHGITMVKFANNCCAHMGDLLARLSVQLGPDTEDLAMRFGLNSGPVTAGVLRGQKSRFQLFGDTVNTASRMESLGERNRIHVSQSTADELIKSGKGHWLRLRRDTIEAKGKGRMVTYWVEPYEKGMSQMRLLDHSSRQDLQFSHREDSKEDAEQDEVEQRKESEPKLKPKFDVFCIDAVRIDRLVSWNVDVLSRLIRGILAHNAGKGKSILKIMGETISPDAGPPTLHRFQGRPINEVTDTFNMPAFDPNQGKTIPKIDLDPVVSEQLRQYVTAIAATYHGSQNPFHNFEHASHVCMSVSKLTHRLVSLEHFLNDDGIPLGDLVEGGSLALFKHEKTFGIASDPLALFACCFSALIHDANHPGVTNVQLVHEGSEWTQKYGKRSIAEQSSVDVAWELLMENRYQELRTAICPSQEELVRLRQMIVNCVMATDLLDSDWNDQRSQRWSKAFDTSENTGSRRLSLRRSSVTQRQMAARKATVVMESLLQASDISHTMQHWNVYLKWNKRLFAEMQKAFENGRAAKAPSEFWYQGELAFFDHCVLPLAKRLKDCGIFGVSSEEYLNYAMKNREEWERRGKEVVAEMTKEMASSV